MILKIRRAALGVALWLLASPAMAAVNVSPAQLLHAGRYDEALAAYSADAVQGRPAAVRAEAEGGMGLVYFVTGRLSQAEAHFISSLGRAIPAGRHDIAARSAMNLIQIKQRRAVQRLSLPWAVRLAGGQVTTPSDGSDQSEAAARAVRSARLTGDSPLEVRARVLFANVAMGAGHAGIAHQHLRDALEKASAGPQPYRPGLLMIADSAINRGYAESTDIYDQIAFDALRPLTGETSVYRARATALLGRLYARAGRLEEALAFTGEASLLLDGSSDDAVGVEIDLQKALLLQAMGRRADAALAYDQLVVRIQALRPTVARLADLERRREVHALISTALENVAANLLDPDHDGDGAHGAQARLGRARDALELSRLVDVEVYFADNCIEFGGSALRSLRDIDPSAAILYPILLDEGVVILMETTDPATGEAHLRRFDRQAPRADVARLSAALKEQLAGNAAAAVYMPASQALYRLLLDDALEALRGSGVKTLVFSPNQELRDVPLAALHDGQDFVIQHYALATALGLSLVNPQPVNRRSPHVLMARLRAGDHEFSELKGVDDEFRNVSELLPLRDLREQDFTAGRLTRAVAREAPDVLHLATHASFSAYSQDSFIRAHQSRISLNDLKALMAPAGVGALDMLVLSACETARGEKDAMLGLAGAAYQAGARSVVGAQWLVNDATAPVIMRDFYQGVYKQGHNKAEALRQAQLAQIRAGVSPHHWAPYLVIGNWL